MLSNPRPKMSIVVFFFVEKHFSHIRLFARPVDHFPCFSLLVLVCRHVLEACVVVDACVGFYTNTSKDLRSARTNSPCFQLAVSDKHASLLTLLLGWRPLLVGWRWWEAIASRLETVATRVEAIAIRCLCTQLFSCVLSEVLLGRGVLVGIHHQSALSAGGVECEQMSDVSDLLKERLGYVQRAVLSFHVIIHITRS